MKGVVLVTGGSSGIGRASAAKFAREGYRVYELSRRENPAQDVVHIGVDVTDRNAVKAAIDGIVRSEGRLDILINNAGFGISGSVENAAEADVRAIFDVNVFGTLFCIQAVLPYMRRQESGRIVNLSSVAAPLSIPYQAFYSATKAAVNSLTAALRNETAAFGIRVCAVMPGDASTGFTKARRKNPDDSAYPSSEHAVAAMEQDEKNGMTPQQVAEVVFRAATARNPRLFYTAGGKYKMFVLLAKLLPAGLCNRIVGRLYR